MRIAVASEGLDVSSHFGCCTNFNFYKVENGDNIVWCYTCEGLGTDVGADEWMG